MRYEDAVSPTLRSVAIIFRSENSLAESVVCVEANSAAKSVKSLAMPVSLTVPPSEAAVISARIKEFCSVAIQEGVLPVAEALVVDAVAFAEEVSVADAGAVDAALSALAGMKLRVSAKEYSLL